MKIKKIFLSLILIVSCFCWVACEKKSDDGNSPAQKFDPTVSVSIDTEIKYYAGDKLKSIELTLNDNSTAGKVSWKDKNQVLQVGNNVCEYVFVPSDTATYNTVTKVMNIQAERALDIPTIENVRLKDGQTVYIDAKYSTVELEAVSDAGDESTITFRTPNTTFKEGENICEWVFNPSNPEFRQMTGSITITATTPQYLKEIKVVANSKKSNYRAFDKFDCTGLTLKKIYNAGKTEIVDNINASDCTFAYASGDCLHQGDTSVTLNYLGIDFTVEIDEVGYYIIKKPQNVSTVYTGHEESFTIDANDDSVYFSYASVSGTDAGDYNMTLTIKDEYKTNCRWADDDESLTTTIVCKILKADQTLTKTEFDGEYDKTSHASTVDSDHKQDSEIYYSKTTRLTAGNYSTSGTKNPISEVDAGNYTIYYYIVGDNNHNDAIGTLSLTIERATPTLELDNCYSIYSGSAVNYSSDYVSILGVGDEVIDNTGLSYSYYSTYEDETKKKMNSAPVNPNMVGNVIKDYVVVVNFAGNKNYASCEGVAKLFIDKADNGLYAKDGEVDFAFKDNVIIKTSDEDENGETYTITGSDRECTNYLKFERMKKDANGVVGISFVYKYGSGDSSILTGILGKNDNGYILICDNGTNYNFTISGDAKSITFTNASLTLSKWEFPNYLGEYSGQTIYSDYDGDKYTTIKIYNDYGTIRFELNVNLIGDSNELVGGGLKSETIKGVVECGFGTKAGDRQTGYKLSCYKTADGSSYREDTDKVSVTIYWEFGTDVKADGFIIDIIDLGSDYNAISKNGTEYIIYKEKTQG